jgi:nucleoid DNA-binding protein
VRTLLDNPSAGMYLIRARLSRFDRDTLVKLLSQRQDLSEDRVNQIVDQVQDSWSSVVHAPQAVADKAKEQYDNVTNAIADYLRNTGKDELNPEGIQRDFAKLFDNPKEGAIALRRRLSQIDRDTLVKLLSQRQDLSEDQVNQIIDQVQDSINSIVKAPRRLARRTQAQVQDFQTTLAEYLRNTGKDALNPEGIKRDLQLLLHDPRVGMESLGDRLAQIDRDTLIKLVSQRQDISEAEATRIVDQVLAVRDQFVEQVRTIQRRLQDVIDGIFARIRNYLNSLDRPELNYDGIKRDVRRVFEDPQSGFDALRHRLSEFNRDTLVALLSSREDISEADANRIIDQIESARNNVLQRAERIQQEAQRRVEEVKRQAAKQAEETRKAAETAAWWLFGTAFVSAIAAALAGAIAVAT